MVSNKPQNTHAALGEWRPSVNPWMVAVSVMLSTFMVVLDSSVANVALPHIAGNLSASTDESTWVLTSYLVSNAIMLPASGWIARRIGRKRLLMISILVFTAASLLCGIAISMPMLIVARVLQGIGGGGMQPLAQSILLESFPPYQHGTAMAVYGVGIVVAPVIGPTWADGSPTVIPGAGSFSSTFPSACWPCSWPTCSLKTLPTCAAHFAEPSTISALA